MSNLILQCVFAIMTSCGNSRSKEVLDWETINKLTIDSDFDAFLKRITIDIKSKEIRKERYDKILDKEELIRHIER